jgi:penicillin-binding protein 2
LYKPLLIKDAQPVIAGKAKMNPETFAIVKSGLCGVVNEPSGTGWLAKSYFTTVAGKTGTAQVIAMRSGYRPLAEKYQDHAWFVAFAPVEKPEIAMAVLVEHGGHGGGAAAPIAKTAIESYMKSIQAPPKISPYKPAQSAIEPPPVSND